VASQKKPLLRRTYLWKGGRGIGWRAGRGGGRKEGRRGQGNGRRRRKGGRKGRKKGGREGKAIPLHVVSLGSQVVPQTLRVKRATGSVHVLPDKGVFPLLLLLLLLLLPSLLRALLVFVGRVVEVGREAIRGGEGENEDVNIKSKLKGTTSVLSSLPPSLPSSRGVKSCSRLARATCRLPGINKREKGER